MSKIKICEVFVFAMILIALYVTVCFFIVDKGAYPYLLLLFISLIFLSIKIIFIIDDWAADKKSGIKWKFNLKNTISEEVGGTFIYFIFWMILCFFRYVKFAEFPQRPDILENTYRYFIQVCMDALVAGLTIAQLNIKEMFIQTESECAHFFLGIILIEDNRLLLFQRKEQRDWILPGSLDPSMKDFDETPYFIGLCGMTIERTQILGVHEIAEHQYMVLIRGIKDNAPLILTEHYSKAEWVKISELIKYPMKPGQRPILKIHFQE